MRWWLLCDECFPGQDQPLRVEKGEPTEKSEENRQSKPYKTCHSLKNFNYLWFQTSIGWKSATTWTSPVCHSRQALWGFSCIALISYGIFLWNVTQLCYFWLQCPQRRYLCRGWIENCSLNEWSAYERRGMNSDSNVISSFMSFASGPIQ